MMTRRTAHAAGASVASDIPPSSAPVIACTVPAVMRNHGGEGGGGEGGGGDGGGAGGGEGALTTSVVVVGAETVATLTAPPNQVADMAAAGVVVSSACTISAAVSVCERMVTSTSTEPGLTLTATSVTPEPALAPAVK